MGGTQFVGLWGFMKNACCGDAAGIMCKALCDRVLCVTWFGCLLEQQLAYFGDVVPAVHPGVSSARIHCGVPDTAVFEIILQLEG